MSMIINPYRLAVAGGGPFGSTQFLCHFDGTNGGTTFTDQCGHTITPVNSPTTSSTQAKFGPTAGHFSTGVARYLDVSPSTGFGFGTGDYTIELWQYLTAPVGAFPDTHVLFDFRPLGTTGAYPYLFCNVSQFIYGINAGNSIIVNATATLNVWQHIAVSRVSGTTSLYLAGTRIGTPYVNSASIPASTFRIGNMQFAASPLAGDNFRGYLDDFRISSSGLYSGATITVPTAAFPDS